MLKNKIDYAIFQFNAMKYDFLRNVNCMSREECEILAKNDTDNVTKFDLWNDDPSTSLQYILNESKFDIDGCFYRVFIG